MKKLFLTSLICLSSLPSFAQGNIVVDALEKAVKQQVQETTEAANYRLKYLQRVGASEDIHKVTGVPAQDAGVAAVIYTNTIIGLAEDNTNLNVGTPIKYPTHAYNGVHLMENDPGMYAKRCDELLDPLECYKLQQNVNVNVNERVVDKVPRDTPCDADPEVNIQNGNPDCNE